MYDLLLKGGEVIDMAQGLRGVRDVALAEGRVAALEDDIPASGARQVIDVSGKFVSPGFIEMHAHVYWGVASGLAVNPDPLSVTSGVTTYVDAGTAGAATFLGFRKHVIERAKVRILPFLHISLIGLIYAGAGGGAGESSDMSYVDADAAIRVIQENRDLIKGIKVRLAKNAVGQSGIAPLWVALDVAEATGLPIMVHLGAPPPSLREILPNLRKGDIGTHIYQGRAGNILDAEGKIRDVVWEARKRGVCFDVGHGWGGFNFYVTRTAAAQGFKVDTISMDTHQSGIAHEAKNFPNVISKFLHLGWTMEEILHSVTARPAQILGMEDEIGTLRVGACGDVAVFHLENGRFEFRDSQGELLIGDRRFAVDLTIRAGQVLA